MTHIRHILFVGSITGTINLAYYNLLDHLPVSETSILMLGFVSLIVLSIGLYIGLLKLNQKQPLSWLQNMFYGMSIVFGASITVILLRLLTTSLSLSKYESIEAYIASGAVQSTLIWYSVVGLVYCAGIHVIIRNKYTKSNKL